MLLTRSSLKLKTLLEHPRPTENSLISVRAYCFGLLSKTGIIGLFLFARAINQNELGEKQNDLHYRPVITFLCLSENTVVFCLMCETKKMRKRAFYTKAIWLLSITFLILQLKSK